MVINNQTEAENFLNNYFESNTSKNNINILANDFKNSNIEKSKTKLNSNYKGLKETNYKPLQKSLKNLKTSKPFLVINLTGFPEAKNININKPEKKEETIKYLKELCKRVKSIHHTVWAKCYKNKKKNMYSIWFCYKKTKLEEIENKRYNKKIKKYGL